MLESPPDARAAADAPHPDVRPAEQPEEAPGRRSLALRGGLWSAASQLIPAVGTAALSVAAGRYLGSGPLGQQSLIAYVNAAAAAILVNSINTAMLQLGGRLQGLGDEHTFRLLTRWCVRAHLATGVVVLLAMVSTGLLIGQERVAWAIIGGVSVLDALADGLAVRLVIVEGWAPMGKLRLVFQFVGPPLGLIFLFSGFGIAGIFFGDGIAAVGLLAAVVRRYLRQARSLGPSGRFTPLPPVRRDVVSGRRPRPTPGGALRRSRPLPVSARLDQSSDTAPIRPGSQPAPDGEPGSAKPGPLAPPVPAARLIGLYMVGAVITQVVSKRIEFVVLAIFATDVAIGMYSVAFMAVNLLSMIPLGIAGAAMPVVAAAEGRGELSSAFRHLRMALRMGTLVSVPLTAVLAVLGPAAVTLVYGGAYGQAARLVPLASTALLVAVVTGLCTQFWSGQGRLAIVLGSGTAAAVADLAVAFALIPRWNATGAVVANLVGQFVLAAVLIYATVRVSGAIGWRLAGLRAMLLASAVGIAAALVIRVFVDRVLAGGSELGAGVVLVCGSIAAPAAIIWTARLVKIFDAEEAAWVRPLVPGRLHPLIDRLTVSGAGAGATPV